MNVKHRRRNGFTLIELLVAIAIIAIVAAILFPVFTAVRERGRRTTCQSNLKQIAIAMQQYVQDNEGAYPSSLNWGYAPYSYLKNVAVFRCPDHPKEVIDVFSIEAMHSLLIWDSSVYPVDYVYDGSRLYLFSHGGRDGVQDASVGSSSTVWLNIDPIWVNPDGTLVDPNGDLYGQTASTSCGRNFVGSTLHSGAGNYSYVDGHVKWLTPEEAGEIECMNGPLSAPF